MDSAWVLACASIAAEKGVLDALPADVPTVARRTGLAPPLVGRLLDVLDAAGVVARERDGAFSPAEQVDDQLAAEARSALLQAADLAKGGALDLEGWRHEDPAILRAQGVSSSSAVPALAAAFPSMGDLAERMERPGGTALDVGTGVGAIAIALCRRFPELRVVGLEPARAPMTEARRNVIAAGLDRRIELRTQRVQDLADEDTYDFAFLPSVFLSTETLRAALPAILRALRPGGWVMTATPGGSDGALGPALARLRATLWGSAGLSPQEIRDLLTEAGYAEVRVFDTPPQATLVPVAARRD